MVKMMLPLVTDEMTAEKVLENETAGISCQHRFKYWVRSTCHIGGSQCGEA